MNEYLKDNLILGDWLEIFFGRITLTLGAYLVAVQTAGGGRREVSMDQEKLHVFAWLRLLL